MTKTIFLRITLWMIVGVALLFSTLLGVQIITAENQLFIEMYIAAAVFWIDVLLAIWIALILHKMLRLIDKKEIFTETTLHLLHTIQKLTLSISIVSIGLMPLFVKAAHLDDAPGLVLFGLGILSIPFAVFVFVSVLKELMHQAVNIQKENELTI